MNVGVIKPKPFPLDLNKSGVQEKIDSLQHWSSDQKILLRNRAHESLNVSNMTSLMEDYFTDVTYMTVAQGRVSVLFLILTILALILYLIWLTVKLNRLRTLTATLAYQAIPLCKAQIQVTKQPQLYAIMSGCQFCLQLLLSLELPYGSAKM